MGIKRDPSKVVRSKSKGTSTSGKAKPAAHGNGASAAVESDKLSLRQRKRNNKHRLASKSEDELQTDTGESEQEGELSADDNVAASREANEDKQDKGDEANSSDSYHSMSELDSGNGSDAVDVDKEQGQAAHNGGNKKRGTQSAIQKKKKGGEQAISNSLGDHMLGSEVKAKKKSKQRHRSIIDSVDDLSPAFRTVIRQRCKSIAKWTYLPDKDLIKREAERLAQAEFGVEHAASLIPIISKELRSNMATHVRGPVATALKKAAREAYSGLAKEDYAATLDRALFCCSYRIKGHEQYGDDRFLAVLRVFSKGGDIMTLAPGQLAFAEYAVWLLLKEYQKFPKGDPEALDAHNEFLAAAQAGVHETFLVVTKTAH
ncbi:hypothetical protein COCOBI_18-3130 [Coccomyxa sp. Obi]|nr:hypothetical protein COCOBI_18-3130 [Coccomyxa sp. Obi]